MNRRLPDSESGEIPTVSAVSPQGTPSSADTNWALIWAEHGQAMRSVAVAEMGVSKAKLGKSADDIVGDVFAERMAKGLPQTNNLRGYLKAAVRYRIRDLYGRSKFESPDAMESDRFVDENDEYEAVEREELRAQAVAALDSLPDRERFAIVERVMKRREARDVGADLGVTGQRVSQLVNAGLERLRQTPAFIELVSIDHSEPARSTVTGPDGTGASE